MKGKIVKNDVIGQSFNAGYASVSPKEVPNPSASPSGNLKIEKPLGKTNNYEGASIKAMSNEISSSSFSPEKATKNPVAIKL